jgi:hypothetical protein
VPDGFVGATAPPEAPELAEVPDGELVAVGTAIGEPYWSRGGVTTGFGAVPRNCAITCWACGSSTTSTSPAVLETRPAVGRVQV